MVSNSTVVESGPESLSTPHLELVNGQVPYRDAVVSWKIPKVELLGEERYIDSFESDCVTHVVLQVSDVRQRQVFSQIGVQHDYGYPFPFWHFLGKMISQALFENETSLEILSFTRVNDREFVGFENKNYPKSSNSTDINAVGVSLKRPRPNEPMEIFWRPARGIIIQFETVRIVRVTLRDFEAEMKHRVTGTPFGPLTGRYCSVSCCTEPTQPTASNAQRMLPYLSPVDHLSS
ncbi:hypothetical protein ACJA88_007163 [Fusarium oxysporum]